MSFLNKTLALPDTSDAYQIAAVYTPTTSSLTGFLARVRGIRDGTKVAEINLTMNNAAYLRVDIPRGLASFRTNIPEGLHEELRRDTPLFPLLDAQPPCTLIVTPVDEGMPNCCVMFDILDARNRCMARRIVSLADYQAVTDAQVADIYAKRQPDDPYMGLTRIMLISQALHPVLRISPDFLKILHEPFTETAQCLLIASLVSRLSERGAKVSHNPSNAPFPH